MEVKNLIQEKMGCELKNTFISNLRTDRNKIMSLDSAYTCALKRKVVDKLAELNDRLESWFNKMEDAKGIITDQVITAEAKRIAQENEIPLPLDFAFSHDWLNRWKRVRNINAQTMHGESGDACPRGIALARRYLPEILGTYALADIYNLDETGLFPSTSDSVTDATPA